MAGLIYSVGVLVEGVPLLATAVQGFLRRDVANAMEIFHIVPPQGRNIRGVLCPSGTTILPPI